MSRLPGADNEAVPGDPGVGDLGVGGGGVFIGVRLGDRLDDQAGGKGRVQPPAEGAAGIGDGERRADWRACVVLPEICTGAAGAAVGGL